MKPLLVTLIITVYLSVILFAFRTQFSSRYDAPYWKDRYEHSQWQLPTSTRTIGDDGLFLYEGYRLINGDNPADYNAEVPPLGKYLIGVSIKIFRNGAWYGFFTTIASLIAFFFLAKKLLRNALASCCATVLLALDPLFISQWPITMLDSLQLFFLLLTLLFLTQVNKQRSFFWTLLMGISFGLFSSTKIPVFSPLLGIIIIVIVHKPKQILIFLGSACIAYLLPYARFFLLGHSILDWIHLQRWIIGFYRMSKLSPNIGSVLTTLLVNRTQNLFTHAWEQSSQWSPIWPLVTMASVATFLRMRNDRTWRPMMAFVSLLVAGLFFIPFWTRYLLLVLPFLYIASAYVIMKVNKSAWIILFVIGLSITNLVASADILLPVPQATVNDVVYSWEHGLFSDIYEHLSTASKTINRQSFHRFGLKTFYDGQIEGATIEILDPHWSRFQSPQPVTLRITYFTRELGPFIEERTLSVVNENGKWAIPWRWEYLIEGFTEHAHVETFVIPARRGSIIDTNDKLLAYDTKGFMVWITPNQVNQTKENAMLAELESAFHKHPGAVSIHDRYLTNAIADLPIPVGTILRPIQEFPGLSFTPHVVRVASESGLVANTAYTECCSLLYSTTNYDGRIGLEKQYNDRLKGRNGGALVIKDERGNIVRTILSLPARDGENVLLDK